MCNGRLTPWFYRQGRLRHAWHVFVVSVLNLRTLFRKTFYTKHCHLTPHYNCTEINDSIWIKYHTLKSKYRRLKLNLFYIEIHWNKSLCKFNKMEITEIKYKSNTHYSETVTPSILKYVIGTKCATRPLRFERVEMARGHLHVEIDKEFCTSF